MSAPARNEVWPLLAEGTRIRHKRAPYLTGYIKHYEYLIGGGISAIPYCIGWDDSARAHEVLGFLFVYASDEGIESIPDEVAMA